MNRQDSIDEETLNAYLDGELNEDEASGVEDALAADAVLRARLGKLAAVSKLSRQVVDNLAREPVPPVILSAINSREPVETTRHKSWFVFSPAMGAMATLVIGILIGINFTGPDLTQPNVSSDPAWHGQAAYFHNAAVAKHRAQQPWDVSYNNRAAFRRFLQEATGDRVDARDLSALNLRIVGGRILHSNERPFPQIYYVAADDSLVSLAMYPEKGPAKAPRWNYAHGRPILGWRSNETAHSLIGDVEPARLEKISAFMRAGR